MFLLPCSAFLVGWREFQRSMIPLIMLFNLPMDILRSLLLSLFGRIQLVLQSLLPWSILFSTRFLGWIIWEDKRDLMSILRSRMSSGILANLLLNMRKTRNQEWIDILSHKKQQLRKTIERLSRCRRRGWLLVHGRSCRAVGLVVAISDFSVFKITLIE